LPDWSARRRSDLVLADLTALEAPSPEWIDAPLLAEDAELLGAAYVLEGSRLGGAVLQRDVPASFPSRFLAAPQSPGAWRKLVEMLDSFLYESAKIDAAVGAAREVFQRFELGGRRYLETVRA